MSLDAMVWAVKDAPTANTEEHAVLTVMADEADEAGCGVYLATSTIAERARMSDRAVQRRLDDMQQRGLIGRGDQRLVAHLRADRRPVVYDLLIPYRWFGNVARVNKARVARGRAPLTPEERPDLGPPPPKKRRADAGKPKQRRVEDPHGVTSSPPVEEGTGRLVARHGVTSKSPRGDYQSPDPVIDPVIDPPPPASSTSAAPRTGGPDPEEEDVPDQEHLAAAAAALAEVYRRAEVPVPRRPHGRRGTALTVLAADALRRGHRREDLVDALTEPMRDVSSVYAVLRHRIDNLPPPAPSRAREPARARQPCARPGCDAGWVEVGGRALACPDCRPDEHGRQLGRLREQGVHNVTTFDQLLDRAARLVASA